MIVIQNSNSSGLKRSSYFKIVVEFFENLTLIF
jgi:hypothetical protein